MTTDRNFLLKILAALSVAICLLFMAQLAVPGGFFFHGFGLDFSCLYFVVPIALALLLISPLMPRTTEILPRIVLALWLALFLWSGLESVRWYDYQLSSWPWMEYFILGLVLGVPIIVISSKKIASLGPVKLTVCSGFLLVLADAFLNLSYGYSWFGMSLRLQWGNDVVGSSELSWAGYMIACLQLTHWVSYRLITYLGLGYILARSKGLRTSVLISILVALVDSAMGWLVLLPSEREFDALPWSPALPNDTASILKVLLAQVADLSILALLGALIALVPWHRELRRPVRFVSATKPRHRPARGITPDPGPNWEKW